MRQLCVYVNDVWQATYICFDRNPSGANFKIIPDGMIEEVEGGFFCDVKDLTVAVSEAIRYNKEQFGRDCQSVLVKKWG